MKKIILLPIIVLCLSSCTTELEAQKNALTEQGKSIKSDATKAINETKERIDHGKNAIESAEKSINEFNKAVR